MTEINFTYAPGTSLSQVIGFEVAGQIWEQYLSDDVDVNIHVEITDQLGPNIIGGALPGIVSQQKLKQFQKALKEDRTSEHDELAVKKAPGDKVEITANHGIKQKAKNIQLTTANAQAVDLESSGSGYLDGYILMSDLSAQDNTSWDYDTSRTSDIDDQNLDFLSVALHETGHILGFVSGVDDPGWLAALINEEGVDKPKSPFKEDEMDRTTPLDLFRHLKKDKKIDMSVGEDAYFSIDGGATNLADFSTGIEQTLGGDGYQASHWRHSDSNPVGIMDPALSRGDRREISSLDILALDVIGWDRSSQDLELDFETLQTQAQEKIAGQLNLSVEELLHNPDEVANALGQDRLEDIEEMIERSQVYEWGTRRSYRGGWSRWQKVVDLLWAEGKFQTLDAPQSNTYSAGIELDLVSDDATVPSRSISVAEIDQLQRHIIQEEPDQTTLVGNAEFRDRSRYRNSALPEQSSIPQYNFTPLRQTLTNIEPQYNLPSNHGIGIIEPRPALVSEELFGGELFGLAIDPLLLSGDDVLTHYLG